MAPPNGTKPRMSSPPSPKAAANVEVIELLDSSSEDDDTEKSSSSDDEIEVIKVERNPSRRNDGLGSSSAGNLRRRSLKQEPSRSFYRASATSSNKRPRGAVSKKSANQRNSSQRRPAAGSSSNPFTVNITNRRAVPQDLPGRIGERVKDVIIILSDDDDDDDGDSSSVFSASSASSTSPRRLREDGKSQQGGRGKPRSRHSGRTPSSMQVLGKRANHTDSGIDGENSSDDRKPAARRQVQIPAHWSGGSKNHHSTPPRKDRWMQKCIRRAQRQSPSNRYTKLPPAPKASLRHVKGGRSARALNLPPEIKEPTRDNSLNHDGTRSDRVLKAPTSRDSGRPSPTDEDPRVALVQKQMVRQEVNPTLITATAVTRPRDTCGAEIWVPQTAPHSCDVEAPQTSPAGQVPGKSILERSKGDNAQEERNSETVTTDDIQTKKRQSKTVEATSTSTNSVATIPRSTVPCSTKESSESDSGKTSRAKNNFAVKENTVPSDSRARAVLQSTGTRVQNRGCHSADKTQPGRNSEQAANQVVQTVEDDGLLARFQHLFEADLKPSKNSQKRPKVPYASPAKDRDHDVGLALNHVQHLSKRGIGSTNLPFWEFAVTAKNDDMLYMFTADVRKSQIPNSGNGLFLTLMSVKELKDSGKKRWHSMINGNFVLDESGLGEPLDMMSSSGVAATLFVEGKFLEEKKQRMYTPESSLPVEFVVDPNLIIVGDEVHHKEPVEEPSQQKASMPVKHLAMSGGEVHHKPDEKPSKRKASMPVKHLTIVGDELHHKPGEEPFDGGIGFAGIFRKDVDYNQSQARFPCNLGSIHLGQYGPFRDEDRKKELLFIVKNWIMSGSPDEWPFVVAELLFNQDQVIDITDDVTGDPHKIARENVLMYVNEVGHNSKLKQNVFIVDNNPRSVHYYFCPHEEMKQGESIELFTNYKEAYEPVRERHGYGWRNLHYGLQSNTCLSERLAREFDERDDVLGSLEDPKFCTFVQLYEIFCFVQSKIWQPLCGLVQTDKLELSKHRSKFRKMKWLHNRFCEIFQKYADESIDDLFPVKAVAEECINMPFTIPEGYGELQTKLPPETDGEHMTEDDIEILEEFCYDVVNLAGEQKYSTYLRERLVKPFDSSLWCPVAQALTKKLCKILHKAGREKISSQGDAILKDFLECAIEASMAVRSRDRVDQLQFASGFPEPGFTPPETLKECLQELDDVGRVLDEHSTVPKGYTAFIFEKIAYLEALRDANLEPFGVKYKCDFSKDECTMTLPTNPNHQALSLAAVPRFSKAVADTKATPHTVWYLVWQVAYVVHVFADEYLTDSTYSVEKLCEAVDLDPKFLLRAIDQGIYIHSPRPFLYLRSAPSSRKRRTKKVKNEKKHNRSQGAPVWTGVPDEKIQGYPNWSKGWKKETYVRQSGASKGSRDRYWFTPENGYKLRSVKEIERFLRALEATNGDEKQAKKIFQRF